MSYLAWKHLHTTAVLLTLLGFALRGWWMWREPAMLQRRWVRVAPHAVDTLLLASGVAMVSYFFASAGLPDWILAKLAGLLAYIALGTVALKRGRTRTVRLLAFGGALLAAAYIIGVAVSKQVAGPLAWIGGA